MIPVGPDGHVEVPRAQSMAAERRALNRLVDGGLARRVDVSVKQRGGGRRGSRELLYFLTDARKNEAAVTAGKLCGVSNANKAKNDYGRGGLKGLHGKVRNDILIRLLYDARAAQARGDDVEVPLEESWAESCPAFPILGAKITHDAAGWQLDEWECRRAGYEEIVPDGRFRVEWPGSALACTFDIELEMGSRTEILADKLDARSAAWLRLYEVAEDTERTVWDAEYAVLWGTLASLESYDAREAAQKRQDYLKGLRDRHKEGPIPYFAGLPEGIVPVVVVMEDEGKAEAMRARLFEAETPRYMELTRRLGAHKVEVGRLFLFAGLDALLPNGVEGPGRTLGASYAPLSVDVVRLSFRDVAEALDGWRENRREAYLMREARAGKSV